MPINYKDSIIAAIIMILLSTAIVMAVGINRSNQVVYYITSYYLAGYYIGNKNRKYLKLINIHIFYLLTMLFFGISIFAVNSTMFPILVAISMGTYIGYSFCRDKERKYYRLFFTGLLLVLFIGIIGKFLTYNWFVYNWRSNGNLPEYIVEQFIVKDGQLDSLNSTGNYIKVYYFWTTTCGYCLKEMPEYNKLSQNYNRSKLIKFYNVYIPSSGDSSKVVFEKYIENYPFEVPLWTLQNTNSRQFLNTVRRSRGYPLFLIMDNSGKIIYIGRFEYKWYIFVDNAYLLLNKILNSIEK